MAVYAIGDVQGCDRELGELLAELKFSADRDSLWFVGDLVNRGPDSLKTLRRIRAMGDAATVILGNHDLHLLAVGYADAKLRSDDTLSDILAASDRDALLEWLCSRPLMHEDAALRVAMVHAGLPPQWDLKTARQCAREFEKALQRDPKKLLERLYGDEPDQWDNALQGEARLRFIINCFTRLRYVDADGRLALRAKGSPKKEKAKALIPWFEAPDARWRGSRVHAAGVHPAGVHSVHIVFGHWSTLGYFKNADVTGIDTGCVWGDTLTAIRIDVPDAKPVQIGCTRN
jgi:bis(5'-nucleosyl)-tetraphosphatase (symmetrical)